MCYFFIIVLSLFSVGTVYINIKQYYQSTFVTKNESVYNQDVYKQLQFLKEALRNGAGEDMQNIFPEGFIFINALYGLSWSEVISNLPDTSSVYKEGIEELTWVIEQTQAPEARLIFDESLPLKYGAFYMGWTTYVLGAKLKNQSRESRNPDEVALFKKNCRMIQYALENQEFPFLESYEGNTWPADGIIAVSCLHINNVYLDGSMEETVENWLGNVKQNLDNTYRLIPHKVSAVTGESLYGVRGCSQSLMLNFIYDIDPEFAKEQFEKYKSLFLDERVGLYGIREYPKGVSGWGDVDSGPVIWGIGSSASVVGQRTMGLFGEYDLYKALRNNIEGFGFGYSTDKEKSYLFGKMPMMDAFFAWSNALETKQFLNRYKTPVKWKFHVFSLIVLLINGYLIIRMRRK